MANYDPNKAAPLDDLLIQKSHELGSKIVHILCYGELDGERQNVDFNTLTNFIPRVGEKIQLEDGSVVEVERIIYKQSRHPIEKYSMLIPNVVARLVAKK